MAINTIFECIVCDCQQTKQIRLDETSRSCNGATVESVGCDGSSFTCTLQTMDQAIRAFSIQSCVLILAHLIKTFVTRGICA